MKTLKILLVGFLLLTALPSQAQTGWGIGACGLYNYPLKDYGLGARVLIPVKEKWWAVPYVYYYFKNDIFSGGVSAMVPFYRTKGLIFYGIASGTFRGSVSVSVNDSTQSSSKEMKAEGELGAGLLLGPGCLKFMVEPRYGIVNEEVILRAGFVLFFDCMKGKGGGGRGGGKGSKGKKRGKSSLSGKPAYCPAYQ